MGIGNASPDVSLDIGSFTDAIHVPVGTTAQRPSSPAAGYFRYNSTTGGFEGYTTEWGAIAGSGGGASGSAVDQNTYTGDGSTTAFTLAEAPTGEDNTIVFIDGVYQDDSTYSVSGTTLTFSTAPANSRVITVYTITSGILGTAPSIDTMTGDGSDTTLTLSISPASENATFVTIDGVVQHKDTYSVSGTTLTFSAAPPNGSAVECISFANTTVTTTKLIQDADEDTKIQVEESSDEDKIRFDTGGTERAIIDSTGLGVGTSSPATALHVNSSGSGDKAKIGNGTRDGFIAVDSSGVSFGNEASQAGELIYLNQATGYVSTFTDGATRIRVDSDGLKFGSDTAAANALDDYEEGTWTPTVATGTVTVGHAEYTKIGNVVHLVFQIGSFSDTTSGNAVLVQGLPFNISSSNRALCMGALATGVNMTITGGYSSSGTQISFYQTGTSFNQLKHSGLTTGSNSIYAYIIYRAA